MGASCVVASGVGDDASDLIFIFQLRFGTEGESVSVRTAEAAENLRCNGEPFFGRGTEILPLIAQAFSACFHMKGGVGIQPGGDVFRIFSDSDCRKQVHHGFIGVDFAAVFVGYQAAVLVAVSSLVGGSGERVGLAAFVGGYADPTASLGGFELLPLVAQFLAFRRYAEYCLAVDCHAAILRLTSDNRTLRGAAFGA